ncbi:transporter [Thermosulfurimonas sp.]|uniref:transporter n=1 Tax=Thermosulfurimonas sp. TaxID=2080236 RepID=UPI0025CE8FDC|nr:transporter [Thermosulfurimonas sp.]
MRKVGIFWLLFLLLTSGISRAQEKPSPRSTPLEETLLQEKGGVLVPRGVLVVEPSIQYSHTSRAFIAISGFTILQAIVLGEIKTEDVKKDVFTASLNFRYGLSQGLQVDLSVPYLYRHDRYAFKEDSTTQEKRVDDSAFGDITFGASYQILYEKGSRPDLVLNFKVKSRTGKDPYGLKYDAQGRPKELPTGNGHWGVSLGLSWVKRSDPGVLFGSVAYFYNFKRTIGGRDYKPGDSVEFTLGVAYALNEKLSLNTYLTERVYSRTEVDGEKQPDTDYNVGILYFGSSYVLSSRTSLNFSVGVGLTDDAPDFSIEIRLPFKF